MKFVSNIEAVVKAIGSQHPGIVMNLAAVPWESDEDRDSFLRSISGRMS